ncbi:unnamed protein product [marine sediment metagenome]|uniref:Thiamine-binding protein domain-containing protein n=1 Tax=marine sediment metagenome TaxID=412755 RepID=X1QG58_9ZZZZ
MQEICTLHIVFPVESDEQALGVKKNVTEALSDIVGVRTDFSIRTIAIPPQLNARSS